MNQFIHSFGNQLSLRTSLFGGQSRGVGAGRVCMTLCAFSLVVCTALRY